ncbi:hypothetical protein X556_1103 [Chlamydia pneumoniae B21]|nr:hypothetical protein X556_1103 [Chlamydia pneumoniae B21]
MVDQGWQLQIKNIFLKRPVDGVVKSDAGQEHCTNQRKRHQDFYK